MTGIFGMAQQEGPRDECLNINITTGNSMTGEGLYAAVAMAGRSRVVPGRCVARRGR